MILLTKWLERVLNSSAAVSQNLWNEVEIKILGRLILNSFMIKAAYFIIE